MSLRTSSAAGSHPRFPGLLRIFEPAPAAATMLQDPVEIKSRYRYWQLRILFSTIVGYALFYFVRKNIGIAMPVMGKDLGISKSDLGLFLTLHGLLYGVSKFANGFFGDRCHAQTFMVVGLVLSALMNVLFGFASAVVTLGVVWMLNGWFQGMGFPPCARLMTHWIAPKELATKMSVWNTSHSIGASLVVVLCGYLAVVNWRLCFFVPAAIALLGALFLWFTLPDTPPSVGLPELAGTEASAPDGGRDEGFKAFVMKSVFGNAYIWLLALANFFVYTMRYAVLDWGPTLLTEAKGVKLAHAGWMIAAFEVSGVAGMLLSGWLTDRIFGGRGARMCVICMALAGVSLFGFWKLPGQSQLAGAALLCAAGFFIYGPQALVGITVANLATKRAAATAIGLTGLFGYASAVLSGWGLGTLVQHRGWDAGFFALMGIALAGTVLFAAAWGAKVHGYASAPDRVRRQGNVMTSAPE